MQKNVLGALTILLAIGVICIKMNFDFDANFNASKTEVYQIAIDQIIERNLEALDGAEYIAVDLNTMGLVNSEKDEIVSYLVNKYSKPVMNSTYLDLIKNGTEKELSEISGLIIYVEKINRNLASAQIHIAIEYASLGAGGVSLKLKFIKGEWIIKEIKEIWVS